MTGLRLGRQQDLVYDRALTPAEVEQNRQALQIILLPREITLP